MLDFAHKFCSDFSSHLLFKFFSWLCKLFEVSYLLLIISLFFVMLCQYISKSNVKFFLQLLLLLSQFPFHIFFVTFLFFFHFFAAFFQLYNSLLIASCKLFCTLDLSTRFSLDKLLSYLFKLEFLNKFFTFLFK